jgi:hypothetical protein
MELKDRQAWMGQGVLQVYRDSQELLDQKANQDHLGRQEQQGRQVDKANQDHLDQKANQDWLDQKVLRGLTAQEELQVYKDLLVFQALMEVVDQ